MIELLWRAYQTNPTLFFMETNTAEPSNTSDSFLPLSRFVSALELACDEKKTGRFYIITDENHSVGLDIDAGVICSVKYRIKRGSEALKLLCETHWLRFRFEENHKIHHDEPALANTAIILHQLENALEEPRVMPVIAHKTEF